ncbi:MAG: thioredoxin-like negative regulator of GroEL, partial [Bacillariaceae sp.]|jgi:thioredoxin-like negative regulator of GroEL
VELVLNGVMPEALPQLILIHEGKIITTWKGVIQSNELQELLEKHVSGITVGSTATAYIASKAPFRGINFSSFD